MLSYSTSRQLPPMIVTVKMVVHVSSFIDEEESMSAVAAQRAMGDGIVVHLTR